MFLTLSVCVYPQLKEFEIKERQAPQFPAVFVNHPDDAAIVVYSSVRDLNFESNIDGIVTVKSETDKYSIIVKTERQIIKVKKSGYIENRISVPKLNARDVRYFSVEEKNLAVAEIPVTIEIDPTDAVIYSDGKLLGASGAHQLSEGVHKLRIEKQGYKSIETDIQVNVKNIFFRYKMEKPRPVVLEVRSVPDKAKIYIDNVEEGETDDQLFKMPGKYEVKLSKTGYLDFTSSVEVKEKGKNIIEAKLEKSSVTLRLDVDPSDASVKINNKDYTPGTSSEFAPGSYLIEISKSGYDAIEENITLERGKPFTKTYKLNMQTGSLQLKVKPINSVSELSLGGKIIKTVTGSQIIDDLPVGDYELSVNAQAYESQSKSIRIKKNQFSEESISLKEIPVEQRDNTKVSNGYESSSDFVCGRNVVTYSGKTYNTVEVGYQCWLKENLDVGKMILGMNKPGNNRVIEKYCYENKPENCKKYGGLYTWSEAMQYSKEEGSRGICPEGWHIPTKAEFQTLSSSVDGNSNALKAVGQGTGGGFGTDASGFSAMLGGFRTESEIFLKFSSDASYWSSTIHSSSYAYYMSLYSDNIIYFDGSGKEYGYSVRCVKD